MGTIKRRQRGETKKGPGIQRNTLLGHGPRGSEHHSEHDGREIRACPLNKAHRRQARGCTGRVDI